VNLYRFHWRGGPPSEGQGDSPADAMNKLGYGQGAVAALDYWEKIELSNKKTMRYPNEH